MTLNLKQQRFAEEYLVDGNATRAYLAAYGGSEKSAKAHGARLVANGNVAAFLATVREKSAIATGVTVERVLAEFAKVAFSDMRDFTTWGPEGVSLRDSSKLSDDAARCVAEVSETTSQGGGSLRFKLHDKVGALTQIAKHLGMFEKFEDVSKLPREERRERLLKLLA